MNLLLKGRFPDFEDKKSSGEKLNLVYVIGGIYFTTPLDNILELASNVPIREIPFTVNYLNGAFIYNNEPVYSIQTHAAIGLAKPDNVFSLICSVEKLPALASFDVSSVSDIIDRNRLKLQMLDKDRSYSIPVKFISNAYNLDGNLVLELNLRKIVTG